MVRSKELSKDQARSLISNVFNGMKKEVERAADTRLSDWERNEQLYCSSEISTSALVQRALGAYDRQVQLIAQRALTPTAMKLADLSPATRDDLLDGAARALVERERLYQLRLTDRLAQFVPNDPIFLETAPAPPTVGSVPIGPTLGEAIDTYLSSKRRSWTAKTLAIRIRYLTYLRQHLGNDVVLASITASDVRAYRDAISRLRKYSGKAVRQTFIEKQTANAAHRIDVWYDKAAMEWGDSIRQKINDGLRRSYFGVVVLSPNFFERPWTQYEFDGHCQTHQNPVRRLVLVA